MMIDQEVSEQSPERVTDRIALDGTLDRRKGAMVEPWLLPAGIPEIPAAFLVDKNGRITFIGNSGALQSNLIEEVLAVRLFLAFCPTLNEIAFVSERNRELDDTGKYRSMDMQSLPSTLHLIICV